MVLLTPLLNRLVSELAIPEPSGAPLATPCLCVQRGEGCRSQPSHSRRTSAARSDSRLATRNTLRRRWATPKYRASRVRHETPYPSCSISLRSLPKSAPLLELKSPGTFSSTSHRGRRCSTRSRKVKARLDRLPANPARLPATLRSWQGNPPDQMSASGMSFAFTSVMLPRFGALGNRSARTVLAYGSISLTLTVSIPARSKPRSNPPTPEKNDACFTACDRVLAGS